MTKCALLVERAQRNLSGAEYSEKHHTREVDCLKATIERLKLEKTKQEKRMQKQEKLLRERLKKMTIRIKELEEKLPGSVTLPESYSLDTRRQLEGEKEDLETAVIKNLEIYRNPLDEDHPHPACNIFFGLESPNGSTHSPRSIYQRPRSLRDKMSNGDIYNKTSIEANAAFFPEIFSFSNGDTEKVLQDGTRVYYYAEIAVSQKA